MRRSLGPGMDQAQTPKLRQTNGLNRDSGLTNIL